MLLFMCLFMVEFTHVYVIVIPMLLFKLCFSLFTKCRRYCQYRMFWLDRFMSLNYVGGNLSYKFVV